jgi:hypothetical protein
MAELKLKNDTYATRVITDAFSRSDTFTVAANGTAVDVSDVGCSTFGMQVKGTGAAATAWNVALEVSLDGTNYATLLTHASADADEDGGVVWSGANASPVLYFRSRLVSVTLGSATNVVATIIGV